jgi:putative peptide zinc metalloprotease protein
MQVDEEVVGAHCLYPPRVLDEIDITERIEGDHTRYIVRNRAAARYFLFKPTEYQIFRQFDGTHTLVEIVDGQREESEPRPSRQSVIKFLTKLDTLGLIARGGVAEQTHGAAKRERGFYIKFPLYNPDSLLKWLDRKIGWALAKPYIIASFVAIALVTFGLLLKFDEVRAYSHSIHSEYGMVVILLFVLTITALHEVAHGLACKHFGGDVREMGVMLIFYVIPALYCNVSDTHRLGRKQQRLWVIFAGIYCQLILAALGAFVWLMATPQTRLADFGFLVLLGGTFNVFINCNPLIKLDGYYALSQLLGVNNLQEYSSAYVRSLLARCLGLKVPPSVGPQRPALYISYWVGSITYTIYFSIWFIVGWAGSWLIGKFGFTGKILTVGLIALFSEKLWRPMLNQAYKIVARMLRSLGAPGRLRASNIPRTEGDTPAEPEATLTLSTTQSTQKLGLR